MPAPPSSPTASITTITTRPSPGVALTAPASVVPAVRAGVTQFLCGPLEGPPGDSAKDGKLLGESPRKFNVAVAPPPTAVDAERVFMTASYDAGSVMVRVRNAAGAFKSE